MLVPPFTAHDANQASTRRWSPSAQANCHWPHNHLWEKDVYDMRTTEILCTAHLQRRHNQLHPARFEYVVHRIFSDTSVARGCRLVSPAAWRGSALVLRRVSWDTVTSCWECGLSSGRIVWVRAPTAPSQRRLDYRSLWEATKWMGNNIWRILRRFARF
ncbi:hypothetical protein B0H16DRAFT_1495406 [Mycena metata]|uniref:Uncharacterized protein n=1 Tax=Mycena metata TaxID=1033252 RepID=A0AAD7P0Y3_9AGAR|nr:hypothetical protein B0H16DRAFT_1495406 [Mycena metata]